MADTRILKSKIEDYVRDWLKVKFGQPFHSKFLALCGVEGKPRTHEFAAVSEDGAIVCSIKKPHHGKLAARSEALEWCMELTWSYISWTMYARAKDTWSSPIQNLSRNLRSRVGRSGSPDYRRALRKENLNHELWSLTYCAGRSHSGDRLDSEGAAIREKPDMHSESCSRVVSRQNVVHLQNE